MNFKQSVFYIQLSLTEAGLILLIERCNELLERLTELQLNTNRFSSIDDDCFRRAVNLEHLSLVGINLNATAHSRVFRCPEQDCFNSLQVLNSNVFNSLSRLQTLYINYNQLDHIPPDLFANQNKLRVLSLAHNRINRLQPGMFSNQDNLVSLFLSYNNLTVIEWNESDRGLSNLNTLMLDHNQIEILNANTFIYAPNLLHLYLNNNNLNLRNQTNIFNGLLHLVILDLSHNRMEYVNGDLFDGLDNLRELSLANNQINVIDDAAFSSIRRLEILDLSQNRLNENSIAKKAFSRLNDLRNLKIFGNPLATRLTNAEFQIKYFRFNNQHLIVI
jgi:platelet glycoprotein V